MRYFIDTEFIESGPYKPIQLISLAIVAEDGREYYAVSNEYNPNDASDWVKENVLNNLRTDVNIEPTTKSLREIGYDILNFIQDKPEFWGYYADYDWVVFCQIFGSMMDLPKGWPMYCNDLKQLCKSIGNPKFPQQETNEHNSLADARQNVIMFKFLIEAA